MLTEPAGLAAWLAVRSEARCCAATFLDCLGVSCAPAGKTALHRAAIDKAMLTKVRAHVFCIAKPGGCEALDLQAKYKAPIWALGLSLGVIAGAALSSRRREDNKPLEMNLDSGRAAARGNRNAGTNSASNGHCRLRADCPLYGRRVARSHAVAEIPSVA